MAGYIIVHVDVTNPEGFKTYQEAVSPSIKRNGGRYIVRGGEAETLEGEQEGRRIVVLEFPTAAQAKAWWTSDEYKEIIKLREDHATLHSVVVEGV